MWIFTPKPRPLDVDASHLINNVNFYLIKEGICHILWLSFHCSVKSFHWHGRCFLFSWWKTWKSGIDACNWKKVIFINNINDFLFNDMVSIHCIYLIIWCLLVDKQELLYKAVFSPANWKKKEKLFCFWLVIWIM